MSCETKRKIDQILPLRRSSEFLQLSKNGYKHRPAKWLTVVCAEADDLQTYFGITVSKKVGSAVARNKLKRWVRYCVQSGFWPKKLLGKKSVFIFRPQAEGFYKKLEFKQFKSALENL